MGRLAIERIAPERGGNGPAAAPAGHCCCCCCCCLHSVGGLVGALIATPHTVSPADFEPIPPATLNGTIDMTPKHSAAGLYWGCTAIVAGVMTTLFLADIHETMSLDTAFWSVALLLPLYQLVGAGVAILAILPSKRLGKNTRLRHVGKLAMYSFCGTMIGIGAMLVVFAMLARD